MKNLKYLLLVPASASILSICAMAQTAATPAAASPAVTVAPAAPATPAVIVSAADMATVATADAARSSASQNYSKAVQAALATPAMIALKQQVIAATGNYNAAVTSVYAKYAGQGVDPQRHTLSKSASAFIPNQSTRQGGSRGGVPTVAP